MIDGEKGPDHDADAVLRTVMDEIVRRLEQLRDEARDHWAIPKNDNPTRFIGWHNRELAYSETLKLLGEAGLAPTYAPRK